MCERGRRRGDKVKTTKCGGFSFVGVGGGVFGAVG